jgi:hypothetical protein
MPKPDDAMMDEFLNEGDIEEPEDGDDASFDDALNTASDIYYRRVEGAGDEGEPAPPPAKPPVKLKPGGPRPKVSLKNLGKAGAVILILCLFAGQALAAARTAALTGVWNSTATWGGDAIPTSSDTVTIGGAYTVTTDSPSCAASTVLVNGGATLALGASSTLTMHGTATIGDGNTNGAGTLTFGPSSELNLYGGSSARTLTLNNCTLRSTATTSTWAKVTGTGGIIAHGTVLGTNPKHDINLDYVSFQNTGTIEFACGSLGTAPAASLLDINHCAFVGTGTITFGFALQTEDTTAMTIVNTDFRDTGTIRITGKTSTPSAASLITNCTFYIATTANWVDILMNNRPGFTISGCIFDNYRFGTGAAWTSGAHIIDGNYFTQPTDTGSGSNTFIFSDSWAGNTFQNNYAYSNFGNSHFIGSSGSGGTGTHSYLNNVMENIYNANPADFFMLRELPRIITGNILLGCGSICVNIATITGGAVTLKNNTVYARQTGFDIINYGLLYYNESGDYTGTINVANNLLSGSVAIQKACKDLTGAPNQVFAIGDYNDFNGVTERYTNIDVTGGSTHDMDVAPAFYDATRSLTSYYVLKGGTSGTEAAMWAAETVELLNLNGYASATKTQSATPTTHSPAELTAWVRAGYRPTNATLRGAGAPADGSPDIGAIPMSAAPVVVEFSATPPTIDLGSSSTLHWEVTGTGVTVSINQGIGSVGVHASVAVTPTVTTTYTLTATNVGGTVYRDVTVIVDSEPPVTPSPVVTGTSSLLDWTQVIVRCFTGNALRVRYSAAQAFRASWDPTKQALRVTSDEVPTWIKISLSYTHFSTGGLTKTIDLYELPAGGVVEDVKIRHSASFTGGTISAYTIQVGILGTLNKYLSAFNVFQAPSGTAFAFGGVKGSENQLTPTMLKVTATSTTANLDAATTGAVDIWLKVSRTQ